MSEGELQQVLAEVRPLYEKARAAIADAVPPYPEPASSGFRTLTFKKASDVQVRPVRWLWDGRIALGTLALVGGREGIGKSTLCYQLAADVTCGRMRGAFYGTPKAVIVVATEDSWEHTIVPRLMAAGADLENVYQVAVQTAEGFDGSLNLPRDIKALERMTQKVGAAMVLLDPLLSRLDASLDSHKDADVRRALEPLVSFADRAHIALLGIMHVNKGLSTDPLTMLMASRAFAAVARSVLFVARDPDNKDIRVLGQPKNNLGRGDLPDLSFTIEGRKVAETREGPVWTSRLVWQGESTRSLDEVIHGVREPVEMHTEVAEAAGWLSDYLCLHQVASSQQVKADGRKVGFSADALKRARQKIGAGLTSAGFPRTTYWSAPGLSPDEVDKLLAGQQSEQPRQSSP